MNNSYGIMSMMMSQVWIIFWKQHYVVLTFVSYIQFLAVMH